MIKISENSETINTPSSEQPSITVDSYDEMSEKLEAQTQGRKNVRIFLTVFALIFLIYIVFYLTLPIFQAKSMKVRNNDLLTREDVVSLADFNHYEPMFVLPKKETEKKVMENSKGLIVSCDIKSNGFAATANIQEDFLKATYQGEWYISSGIDFPTFKENIQSLPLDDTRKTLILDGLVERKEKYHLPELHLTENQTFDEKMKEYAFKPFAKLKISSLSMMEGYEFYNEHPSSSVALNYNTVNLLLKQGNSYFLLEKTLIDQMPLIFSENGSNSLAQGLANFSQTKKDAVLENFRFYDSTNEYAVYKLHANYNFKSGNVDITLADGTSAN